MLVYFVNHSTAPVNLGGAERSMLELVADWYAADPDFEAFFLTKAPRGKFIEALEQRGWAYRAFRFRGWAGPKAVQPSDEIAYFARDDHAATLGIVAELEKRRPDLVVTNTLVAPWGAFAAAIVGIPHAWFVREYGDLDHGLTFTTGREATFADIGLLSQSVFTNSLALKAHIGQYLDEGKVTVVYPRVDTAAVQAKGEAAPETPPFPQADPGLRITVVGRLSQSKGQWRVIDAVAELASRGITASACFVGGHEQPGYDADLRARAAALGVRDRITIAGERANPFPYIRAAHVCVTPSGIEAFGRSTLEYLASGRAVIASNGGGSAELVDDGVTGYLFDAADPAQLVELLAGYATDPDLVVSHGLAAAARALDLSTTARFSNTAAIARLKATALLEPYRLPQVTRSWLALAPHFWNAAGGQRITLSLIVSRLRGRIGRAVRRRR